MMASPGAAIAPASTASLNHANASAWANFSSSWTRFAPSLEDLILAGPRMLTRIGSIISFPEAIDSFGSRLVPDPTGSDYFVTTTTSEMAADISEAVAKTASVLEDNQDPAALVSRFTMEGSAKGLGSVFSYATSKWALSCIVMAIILNRTHVFAASRVRLILNWPLRLLLRSLPIILFVYQSRQLLQAIQCQTSSDFAQMRWGNATKSSDLMFAEPSRYLHGLSSTLLLGASDYDSCRAIHMIPSIEYDSSTEMRGSLSQLWPLFGTLCLSHFIETVSCALQGRPVATETGITLFEHSLAFAEADAAISNQLGWGLFSGGNASTVNIPQASGTSIAISRSMIMRRVNTPPEVLLVAFLSSMSHLTSHILAVFGLQNRYRIFSTGFWAMCFMGSLVVEIFHFSLDNPSRMGLFRFPTVCIIGFVPHLMVLAGILICLGIHVFAVLLSLVEVPGRVLEPRPRNLADCIAIARSSMQAYVSLANMGISRSMDFYTALLRVGFSFITMASEAVFLNVDENVVLKQTTWLEDQRFRELEALRQRWAGLGITGDSQGEAAGTIGLIPIRDDQVGASSGYARERAGQTVPKSRIMDRRARDGVGAAERSSRWLLALEFLVAIQRLALRWTALLMLKGLKGIGVRRQPRFLLSLARWSTQASEKDKRQAHDLPKTKNRLGRNNRTALLTNKENVDIEAEIRELWKRSPRTANAAEEELDSNLYFVWKHGELWGGLDNSGDWTPEGEEDDWDNTSVITSTTKDESSADEQWLDEDDTGSEAEGQRTPTQANFSFSRETTPADQTLDVAELARLLHPRTAEERQEAHALAAHLNSDRIVTRSQYARMQRTEKSRVLLSGDVGRRQRQGRMTDAEEAELLEQLIISRREEMQQRQQQGMVGSGDDRETDATLLCVVCQTAPRKIIVWPCRCLCLCDMCRSRLAMNNFDKCVCCRRDVLSFSRIYVP